MIYANLWLKYLYTTSILSSRTDLSSELDANRSRTESVDTPTKIDLAKKKACFVDKYNLYYHAHRDLPKYRRSSHGRPLSRPNQRGLSKEYRAKWLKWRQLRSASSMPDSSMFRHSCRAIRRHSTSLIIWYAVLVMWIRSRALYCMPKRSNRSPT